MDRKAAHEHLQRVAGLTVQAPNQAQHPYNQWMVNDGPGLLAVTSGLCSAYRVTSAFGKSGKWTHQHIKTTMAIKDACKDAAINHPLY